MGQNGEAGKLDLREYVTQVAEELTHRIDHQRNVLLKFVEDSEHRGRMIDYHPFVECTSRHK